jgi:recombinational DNA repair protein (RecF pathway)
METQKNTKICSCCGREYELKYFHRSYSVCKLCISKIKHDKYEQKKRAGIIKPYAKKGTKKDKIEELRKKLAAVLEKARILAKQMKVEEYNEAMCEYSKIYYQMENLKAI